VLEGEHWVDEGTSPYQESAGMVLLAAPDRRSLDRYQGAADFFPPKHHGRAWTDDYTNVWGAMIARFEGK
jgi:hypothetical protein